MTQSVRYVFHSVLFEWDARKAAANLSKHGIPFELACEVFFDPFVTVTDASESDEARDAAIGYTESQTLLVVVHVKRHEEAIRIISARRASNQERRIHEQH
jgi:uncharacterized protein